MGTAVSGQMGTITETYIGSPWLALDGRAGRDPTSPDASADDDAALRAQRSVRCRACDHGITSAAERVEVDGRTEHVHVNPSGIPFHVVCYRTAPGCAAAGPRETFWSWFEGHTWQIALCARCGRHLGWRFEADGTGFHGLVASRIHEDG